MILIINIFSVAIAIEFLYIMYLETFATSSSKTSKIFKMSNEELNKKSVKTLFKNQGIYNGLLSIGIFYAVFLSNNSLEIISLIMVYIIMVAAYGSYSSGDKSIVIKQAGLSVVNIILIGKLQY